MRMNVYSQELTSEVAEVRKEGDSGEVFLGARLFLHSSPMLHNTPTDDDRSAITFWTPKSKERREEIARAFERLAAIFRDFP